MRYDRTRAAELLLVVTLFVVYYAYIVRVYEPFTFGKWDAGWQILSVQSLIDDSDLDLRNQLKNLDQAEDQIALGPNGEWFCVHERLMPLLTVPFYLLFRINGALLFNALLLLGSMVATYRLALTCSSPPCAAIATFIVGLTVTDWSYSYSIDVFGAFLLIVALLAAIKQWNLLAGFLFSLSVVGRLSSAVTAPAFLYLLLTGKSPLKSSVKFALAAVPVFLLFLLDNWRMYGGPFELSYFHQAYIVDGALAISSQKRLFSVNPLEGLTAIFFDRQLGFFVSYPVAAISYILGFGSWRRNQPRLAIACVAMGTAFVAFYAPYSGSIHNGGGMRHFLPLIELSAIPLSLILERFVAMPNTSHKPI